ncbi:MAG: fumarylacetoacetate hydrolase family protein [Oscillospiraceae bacterium]|jgi:2-keto-4-pentenoate hydratase/2-oxohepta-3-ene-1,7-dioic acid hydratase in catechol pathway|nr:fumarylacetoacetate hydrolase family protein [Oscillospiraceae bacterium]
MRLTSFEGKDGGERWGIVVLNPADGRQWVYDPGKVDRQLQFSATATNGFAVSMPRFMPQSAWPQTFAEFLALEENGMEVLRRLERFLLRFLEQGDEARMTFCGFPLDEIQLLAPISRPRLMWGLVQNCPTFVRSNPERVHSNLFPQGHQRPQGSVMGHGQLFYQPKGTGTVSYNVELGVVIGKKGRYIPVHEAMGYVAGYTVVIDAQINGYHALIDPDVGQNYAMGEKYDWFVDATCSWGGKMADAHCTVGPWVVTPDEVGNPYDLLVYTGMSGHNRDRAHTAALLIGIERTIGWYSSFATLYPGDIIHMGTMGTDGLRLSPDLPFNGPGHTVESTIERIGTVSSPVLNEDFGEWRDEDDPTRLHVSPAVRALIASGQDKINMPQDWEIDQARHFFTAFKNYRDVQKQEGLKLLKTPRFLCAPNSALGQSGQTAEIPPRGTDLIIGVELGVVLGRLTQKETPQSAENAVLGYTPLISVTDCSFADVIVEPATRQEKGLPTVYGRWADGFNTVLETPVAVGWDKISTAKMALTVEGLGEIGGSVSEYITSAPETVAFISTYITLFPGDVITLGQTKNALRVPRKKYKNGLRVAAEIEGLGSVSVTLMPSSAERTDKSYNSLNLG